MTKEEIGKYLFVFKDKTCMRAKDISLILGVNANELFKVCTEINTVLINSHRQHYPFMFVKDKEVILHKNSMYALFSYLYNNKNTNNMVFLNELYEAIEDFDKKITASQSFSSEYEYNILDLIQGIVNVSRKHTAKLDKLIDKYSLIDEKICTLSDALESSITLNRFSSIDKNWCKQVVDMLSEILVLDDGRYFTNIKDLYIFTYRKLDERAKIKLYVRHKNRIRNMEKMNMPKTKIDSFTKLKLIEQDSKLRACYTEIVKELLLAYKTKTHFNKISA